MPSIASHLTQDICFFLSCHFKCKTVDTFLFIIEVDANHVPIVDQHLILFG